MNTQFVRSFFIIIIFILFILPTQVQAEVEIRSSIRHDETWSPYNGPYVIHDRVEVMRHATLTILPGTQVLFTGNSKITVRGTLIAQGVVDNRIVISRASDDDLNTFLTPPAEENTPLIPEEIIPKIPLEPELAPEPTPEPELIPEDLPEVAITEPFEMFLASEESSDTGIYITGNSIDGYGNAEFSHVDFSDTDYAVTIDKSAVVAIEYSTFSNHDFFSIYDIEGILTVDNSTFLDGAVAGYIQTGGSFEHSNNTFYTDIPGWEYHMNVYEGMSAEITSPDGAHYFPNLHVHKNAALVIGPGVSIFSKDIQIDPIKVEGTLTLQGTANQPVIIYGEGECSSHTPFISSYRWWGYTNPVPPDPIVTFEHVQMKDLCGGIVGTHGTLSFDYVSITGVDYPALQAQGTAALVLKNSAIENTTIGAWISSTIPPVITNTLFSNNGIGVKIDTEIQTFDVRNNNWGSDNGPTIASNPEGDGDRIVVPEGSPVLYCSWIRKPEATTCPPTSWSDIPIDEEPVPDPLPTDRDPLIIIPGIIGTELIKNYDDYSEVWPNLSKVIQNPSDSQLDDLALLVAGEQSPVRPMVLGEVVLSIQERDIFDGLISELVMSGYVEGVDLFVLPYDWRLSNAGSAQRLYEKINQTLTLSGKTSVDIIGHSMGGIVAKEYIAQYGDTKVDQLFFIGTPHLGSPKAFKTLMYGDDMGFSRDILGIELPFLSSNRIFQITQNMPSIHELLPTQEYFSTVGPYIADVADVYVPIENEEVLTFLNHKQTQNFMGQQGRNERFNENATTLHARADDTILSDIDTYNFAGCGVTKTLDTVLIKKKRPTKIFGMTLAKEYELYYGAGDGVVPLESAKAINSDYQYYVRYDGHATLPSFSSVRATIASLLRGTTPELVDTISNSSDICGVSGNSIGVHSPVRLDIYEGLNGHTGPVVGDIREIEYGIPGVQYDVIEDEKFAFLPEGIAYTLVFTAEDVGVFDVSISESNEYDTITTKRYYYNIPIAGLQTKAYLQINADGTSDYKLHIDQDGDGIYESFRTPAGTVTGLAATDTTPPVTEVLVDDELGLFTLSASDADTGILETLYSLDEGISWNHYWGQSVVAVSEETEIEFFSIDNLGNTEAVQQITVSIAGLEELDSNEEEENPDGDAGDEDTDSEYPENPDDVENPDSDDNDLEDEDPILGEDENPEDSENPNNPDLDDTEEEGEDSVSGEDNEDLENEETPTPPKQEDGRPTINESVPYISYNTKPFSFLSPPIQSEGIFYSNNDNPSATESFLGFLRDNIKKTVNSNILFATVLPVVNTTFPILILVIAIVITVIVLARRCFKSKINKHE